MFGELMHGNASVITDENIKLLNNRAMDIYGKAELDQYEIEELKKIIMICNVLYNRTDMTVLPIEDGFYDLLLEKYKVYDEHFQVGSAVVDFRNFIENDLDGNNKIAEEPLIFFAREPKDETHQMVYDNIMHTNGLTKEDFYTNPIEFNDAYINKRTHDTEHSHPALVGTLDKCKFVLNKDAIEAGAFNDPNVKVLERDFFQEHMAKGYYGPNDEIEVVCELKYDGISVEADCTNVVVSARTRGDTGIGKASDLTPILHDYPFRHAGSMIGEEPLGVKFEAIMTKGNLQKFNELRGRSYANCRSAIVGLFGASDAYMFRDLITLVPLAIDTEQIPLTRLQEIEFINRLFTSHGQPLRYCYFKGNVAELLYLIKVFWDEAKLARDELDFLYDGIVLSYTDPGLREKLGRKNYINKYSMAVKFDPLEKQTIFRGYTFEVGQNGTITPMIHYDPVEFLGTIHTKSTGSSYSRFVDLGLKYGDYINVKYVNDVMPYVSRVECEHNRNNQQPLSEFITECPICGSKLVLSDSGKTMMCPNLGCSGRALGRMVNMFAKLNIKGFADAAFISLNITHLYEIVNIGLEDAIRILGNADGKAFIDTVRKLTTEPLEDFMIMGAIGFTGIARKKWQNILQYITVRELYDLYKNSIDEIKFREDLLRLVPGIGDLTSLVIANEMKFFEKDIEFILSCNLVDSKGRTIGSRGQIRFTGCRNTQLAEQLNTAGWDAGEGSVTKKTVILVVPYDGFSSNKVNAAMKNGCKIVPIDDMIKNLNDYIL